MEKDCMYESMYFWFEYCWWVDRRDKVRDDAKRRCEYECKLNYFDEIEEFCYLLIYVEFIEDYSTTVVKRGVESKSTDYWKRK
jgi:hypothetical protein